MRTWSIWLKYLLPTSYRTLSAASKLGILESLNNRCAVIGIEDEQLTMTFNLDAPDAASASNLALTLGNEALEAGRILSAELVGVELLTHEERDKANQQLPNVLGVAEIADRLGITRQRVTQLAKSQKFPQPATRLAMGPIWLAADLEPIVEERSYRLENLRRRNTA